MAYSMKEVNEVLEQYGVELVKGEGYFYYMPVDGNEDNRGMDIPSVYVNRLNDMTKRQWVDHAADYFANLANNPCATECSVVPAESQTEQETEKMTDTPETTEAAVDHDAVIAAATDAVPAAKAALKAAKADVTEANKNVKLAEKAVKGAGDDAEAKAAAEESLTSWKAAQTARVAAVETAKAAVDAATQALKDAKSAKRAAGKPAPKAKVERNVQNGITHPLPGSKCGDAWAICDELTTDGYIAKMGHAVEVAESRGLSAGNMKCEYNQWRKFHGHPVQGRYISAAKQAEMDAAAAAKAEAAAAKAAAKAEAVEAAKKTLEAAAAKAA